MTASTPAPRAETKCFWCWKQRRSMSEWEQSHYREGWQRLCKPCARVRLNNPWNALLGSARSKWSPPMSDPVLPGEGPVSDEQSPMSDTDLAAFAESAPDRIDCELWTLLDWSLWGAGMADVFREPLASTMVAAVPAEVRAQAEMVMAAWLEHRGVDSPSRTNAELRKELAAALSECAALAAKVAELEGGARLVQARAAGWDEGYEAGCESDPDSLIPGNNPYRTAPDTAMDPFEAADDTDRRWE